MFIEICLAILTATSVTLIFVLLRICSKVQQSIRLLQTDIHNFSKETVPLLNAMSEFVRSDLHVLSEESKLLLGNLSNLSSDIQNKSQSLNFLFKPLSFLSSKFDGDLSCDESASKCETIPQELKWIASSALLLKIIREIIKKYEK